MNKRTVLIGLDGATFTILDYLMETGIMPFLQSFIKGGVHAELISTIPPLTPPAWTSLMTGRNPGAHGVFDFFQKEKSSHRLSFNTHQDIQTETIWSIVSRSKVKVTTLNFPLMLPPPSIAGNVISGGWLTARQLPLACHPADLYDRIKSLPDFNARELALDMSHEEKALEGCKDDEYEKWIRLHIRRERQWFNILKYLMKEAPSQFYAILFDGVDKLQHLCWRFLAVDHPAEQLAPWEHRVRELCFEYFSEMDGVLSKICTLAGPDATVVMASDHGFGPQKETFFVNAWLAKNGYLKWADKNEKWCSSGGKLGMSEMAKHIYKIDWDHTVAYASTPSSNGIHIVKESPEHPNGISSGAYEGFRRKLTDALNKVVSPSTGNPIISNIWTREEAFDGDFSNLAPDLTLVLQDGGLVSILSNDSIIETLPAIRGSHRMEGIFLAKGPGIRTAKKRKSLSILDIAPILLQSLNIPIPTDFEGRIPDDLFGQEFLERNPIKHIENALTEQSVEAETPKQPVFDAEAEAKMAEKLRALGYIE